MHLVLVSSLVPIENPGSGFDIANRALLDGLVALGHRVSVVGYLQPGQKPAPAGEMHLLGELEVTNAKVGAATKLKWLGTALLKRTTLSSAKMLKTSARRMEEILRSLAPFDGLVLNSVQLPAAFFPLLRRYPFVYVAHNAEADTALENASEAPALSVEKYLFLREARHLRALEQQLVGQAAHIWTFSEADRFAFGQSASRRASVLPLVTQWATPVSSAIGKPAHDLGLIGTWSWKANRTGLDWFLNAVVPLLPPDLSIAVAGQLAATPDVAHPGLRFLGRVPAARAFVRDCAVVPLISRGGSGVQLKTIETFEMGMPSVATTASLRGIGIVPENCVTADDAVRFAHALVERVAAVRQGVEPRLPGSVFHAAQKSALVEALAHGVSAFGRTRPVATADRAQNAAGRRNTASPPLMVQKEGEAR